MVNEIHTDHIKTVKTSGSGWLLNGTMFVPDADNRYATEIRQWISEGNTPDPEFTPAQIEATRIQAIKAKAGRAIHNMAPEWKQRNMLARSIELTEIQALGGALSVSDAEEVKAIKLAWSAVQAIREASDLAEADGTLAKDFNP